MPSRNTQDLSAISPSISQRGAVDVFESVRNFGLLTARSYFEDPSRRPTELYEGDLSAGSDGTYANVQIRNRPKFALPERPTLVSRIRAEQEFEGMVLEVQQNGFVARLHDLTNLSNPEEDAEISFSEVSPDDLGLVVRGALFCWVIGLREKDRQITRISEIRFRRMFVWPEDAVTRARARGRSAMMALTGELPLHSEGADPSEPDV
ncbi:MAG: hypothetical protein HYX43_10470 [Burkholderiales bacterium]|nr:hypothetical protein [Burkholderiales bacterium]